MHPGSRCQFGNSRRIAFALICVHGAPCAGTPSTLPAEIALNPPGPYENLQDSRFSVPVFAAGPQLTKGVGTNKGARADGAGRGTRRALAPQRFSARAARNPGDLIPHRHLCLRAVGLRRSRFRQPSLESVSPAAGSSLGTAQDLRPTTGPQLLHAVFSEIGPLAGRAVVGPCRGQLIQPVVPCQLGFVCFRSPWPDLFHGCINRRCRDQTQGVEKVRLIVPRDEHVDGAHPGVAVVVVGEVAGRRGACGLPRRRRPLNREGGCVAWVGALSF